MKRPGIEGSEDYVRRLKEKPEEAERPRITPPENPLKRPTFEYVGSVGGAPAVKQLAPEDPEIAELEK